MAGRRKGLGRGLDALLGGATGAVAAEAIAEVKSTDPAEKMTGDRLIEIPIEYIQRGKYQPRRDMHQEALEELANSIKAQGVMQPIIVRPIGERDGHATYEIIAGERRWRATQLAGLDKIPAIIRDVSDETTIAMALIENIQREDLNPMEEAVALKRLQDEFELTHQQVAEAVGKSRTTVTNLLRLIGLTDDVKTMLEHGDLEMGHARSLLSLDAADQRSVARQVVAKGLSVRQTEALVRRLHEQQQKPIVTDIVDNNHDVEKLEENLSQKVGVPVKISYNAKGKGKLVLNYNSLDELDGILSHLGYSED